MVVDNEQEESKLDIQALKKLFHKDQEHWREIYQKARDDLFFLSDDPMAQWDEREYNNRVTTRRPALTIDQLGQFVHQVVNDIRMNTPTINCIPSDGADPETAQIIEGLIKNIEYKSNADEAYDTSTDFSVRCSIGYIRVDHDYTGVGFEQDFQIKRVVNPLAIYLDSESVETDGSDARHGWVVDELTEDEFEARYPGKEVDSFELDWDPKRQRRDDEDKIKVVEFFQIRHEERIIGQLPDGSIQDVVDGVEYLATRSIKKPIVYRYMLSGKEILSETTFPSDYIPLIPVYGEEAWESGVRKLRSLIRKSKGAQRNYNYWKSLETELLLKQPNAPIIAAEGQTEEYEADYKNPEKTMVLRYKQVDIDGRPAPAPQRLAPPTIPTGIINAAKESVDDIKATLGMYNASIGARSNETSGIAIQRRQQEGDVANFHFGDNLVRSICQVGRVVVSGLARVYDTPRFIRTLDAEGNPKIVGINGALAQGQERTYDLTQGEFDVKVTTAPSFTTMRQEGAEFYSQLLQSMGAEILPIAGDLVFKYQSIPGAEALSERFKKVIDPKFLSEEDKAEMEPAIDPEKAQMQAALQEMAQQLQMAQQQLDSKQSENVIKIEDLKLKRDTETTKAQLEAYKLELEAKKLELEQLKIVQDGQKAQETTAIQQPERELPPIKLDTTGFQFSKTPEQLALEEGQATELAQKEDLERQEKIALETAKLEQGSQLIQAIQGIQVQVAELAQQSKVNAAIAAAPIEVIRDENGIITGAV